MEQYENVRIKELIKKYPQIAKILGGHDIDCVSCRGNCYFKDIVEAENLSMEQEMEIIEAISQVVDEE